MTDYWISGAKYWCEDCKKYISDNKASRKHHESGATHQTNRKKRLDDIKKKNFEQNKESTDLDREFQRINKEAIHQHYQDLAQQVNFQDPLSSLPTGSDGSVDGNSRSGSSSVNPAGVGSGDWSYFDEEMIAAQRKRLYGNSGNPGNSGNFGNSENSENSDSKPPEPPKKPYRRRRAPENQEEEETNGGNEYNGDPTFDGNTNDEPYDPDVHSDEENKELKITRETAGIAGAYKEVDPSTLYNQYYRLSTELEEDQSGGGDFEEEEFQQSEITKKRKKEISTFDDEENGDWLDGQSGTIVSQERQMEKSLSEVLEEGNSPVVWKKPKLGANKRGRRKK